MAKIARDLHVSTETLRKWVNQAQIDAGERDGFTTEEKEELRGAAPPAQRGEGSQRGARDLKKSGIVLRQGGGPPSTQVIYAFIETEKANHRVGVIRVGVMCVEP